MNDSMDYWDQWQKLIDAAARIQELIEGCVLVGGSAAAIHLQHRISFDADHVLANLGERYGDILDFLEGKSDWKTARLQPPKLILGSFHGVETGLRQLRRTLPLETETVTFAGRSLVIPTLVEMLRIKAWMIVSRNATRDYIDFSAISNRLGIEVASDKLIDLDVYYQDLMKGVEVSPLMQLAKQLADPVPRDLDRIDVPNYKGIKPPINTWQAVSEICREVARQIAFLLSENHDMGPVV